MNNYCGECGAPLLGRDVCICGHNNLNPLGVPGTTSLLNPPKPAPTTIGDFKMTDSDKAREIAFKEWCRKHFLIFLENAFAEGNAIEHPVITCFNEHYDIIESHLRTIEEKDTEIGRLKSESSADKIFSNSDEKLIARLMKENEQLQARVKELEDGHRLIASCINTVAGGDQLPRCLKPELTLWSITIANLLIAQPGEPKP